MMETPTDDADPVNRRWNHRFEQTGRSADPGKRVDAVIVELLQPNGRDVIVALLLRFVEIKTSYLSPKSLDLSGLAVSS